MIFDFFFQIWTHRRLTVELSKRDLTDRFLGQVLGSIWVIIHPTFQIGVLIFLYSFIFKARLNLTVEGDYTAYILSGLIPWLTISETLSKSTTCIRSKASLVKQVIFPIQILPLVSTIVSLIPQLIGMVILIVYSMFNFSFFHYTLFLLPVLLVLQVIAMTGVAYFLATVGVYLRDIKDVIALFCAFGVYLSPVVYFIEWVPEKIRFLIYLNPITHIVFCYQDVLFYHSINHQTSWIALVVISFASLFIGYSFFNKFKHHFGSVL